MYWYISEELNISIIKQHICIYSLMSLNGHIDMQVNKLALFGKPWFNVMFNAFNDVEKEEYIFNMVYVQW